MICPNCGFSKSKFLFEAQETHGSEKLSKEEFKILKCEFCGLVFPQIDRQKDYFKKYYPQDYYSSQKPFFKFLQKIHQFFSLAWMKFFLYPYLKKGRLLDFGCGQGQFLASFPKSFEKYGLEINPQAVGFIKKNHPEIKVFENLSFFKKGTGKFDLITLWHVLEHLDKPQKTLKGLAGLLKTGGLIILSTPNSSSFGFKIGQADWFHLDAPRHLAIFNLDNLVKLCQNLGLKVIKTKGNWFEFPLDLYWSVYNRYKRNNFGLNFLIALFILPTSLASKFVFSLYPKKSETILIVCQKG